MAFMRHSKFRHVFGKPEKRDQCYDGIRITKTSWESTYCAVNSKFVAVITEAGGGGSFLVLPLSKVGRVPIDNPLVAGHKGAVLDIQWCPHNDNIIASASDDCTVKVWEIPDSGLVTSLTEPLVELYAHQKRVCIVAWHPTAEHVLVSSGSDQKIYVWNLEQGDPVVEIDLPDMVWSISFNLNGSLLACTAKDKKLRVINPHTGEITLEAKCHEGSKPSQCCFMKDGNVFTTGFSKMSERQYALWDGKDLKQMSLDEIDASNGVMFIFYDPDTNMIYLAGKGDSLIRFYEVTDKAPFVHYLNLYNSSTPQRGMGYMPKRALNVNSCEIARFYKLHNQGLCEVISFTVPRKSELFQDDLYPDTASDEPALTADQFFEGKDSDPIMVSLKGGFKSTQKEKLKVGRRSNFMDKMPSRASTANNAGSDAPAAAAAISAPALPPGFDPQAILDDMRKLKLIIKAHERRIKSLEEKLAQYESEEEVEEDA